MPNPPSTMASHRGAWLVQGAIILAALACGTAFWLVIQLTTSEETSLPVTIEPVGLPEEVRLDPSWAPKETLVKFTFPRAIRDDMKAENFRVVVNFANVRSSFGNQLEIGGSTPLTLNDVETELEGVTPVEILSRQISWTARLGHAKARVIPDFVGEPADGFERKSVTIQQSDKVQGDELTVIMTAEAEKAFLTSGEELLIVKTEPIDLSGRNAPFFERRELIFPYPGMAAFPARNSSVLVEVDIDEKTTSKIVADVPIVYSTLRKDLEVILEPAKVQVSVTGKTSALARFDATHVRAEVWGVPELPGESRELPVDCRVVDPTIRRNIFTVESVPRTVIVRVRAIDDDTSPTRPSTTPR